MLLALAEAAETEPDVEAMIRAAERRLGDAHLSTVERHRGAALLDGIRMARGW